MRAGALSALLRRALGAAAMGTLLSGCCESRTQPGYRFKVVSFTPTPKTTTSG